MSANAGVPEPTTAVRIVAHRGDAEAARENTLAAVVAAIEAGATDIEVDVRTSADRVSVVIHDPSTLRLWGHAQLVAEQSAAELASLGTEGTRIPTLAQVVEALAEVDAPPRLLVGAPTAEDAVTAWTTLRTQPAIKQGQVQVSWRGSDEVIGAIRDLDDQARLHLTYGGGDVDAAVLAQLRGAVVEVEFCWLSADLVDRLHQLDVEVLARTLEDAEHQSWAIDIGVDQIVTSRPRLLRDLATKGYSPLALAWADRHQLAARLGLGEDLAHWIAVARHCAEWTIAHTRTAALGSVESKAHPADVVSAVDRSVEQHLRAVIAAELPDHVVVGEEFGGEPIEGRPTWYLDPVDGTTNLVNHLPWTSMSLALAVDGQPVVAVVCQPWTGDIFLAARGLGATLNGRPLQLTKQTSLAGTLVMTESSAHQFHDGQVEFMTRLGQEHCATRVMGSGTLTLTQVAAGAGIAGMVPKFHPIDHLAGALIAFEAGAWVMNSNGEDNLFPTEGGLMVAAPGAAAKLWPLWQPDLAGVHGG